uniref:Uncharacterized protein n=1 Tax=Helianthus annuus TaxID=4232 RepID=A0A251UH43_HELAN
MQDHFIRAKYRITSRNINSDVSQENKQTQGNQWRGDKGGRGTFYASKVFEGISCANVNGTPTLSNGNYNRKLSSEPPAA